MNDLRNWIEKTKGFYRYVIAAKCCYEIHVMRHDDGTDILDASAQLYLAGDWYDRKAETSYFERELLFAGPVRECLEKAVEDDKKNNS